MHYCARLMGYDAKNLPLGEKMVAYGADLNARNNEGMTPLMVMLDEGAGAIEKRPALVEFLISHGADITIKDNEGKIALEQFIEQYGLSKNYYYSHEEKKAAYGGRAHRTGRYCGQLVGTKNAEKKHSGKYFHFGLERKA